MSDTEGGMHFCEDHWERLRSAIDDRGLSHLIAADVHTVVEQTVDQLNRQRRGEDPVTPVNYDPLMGAHWAITNNVMNHLGPNFLYLMMPGPEDPVEGYGEKYEGRTWPRCPLCYINLAHEVSCKEKNCVLPKENGFDWMIDRAADDAVEHVKKMEKSADHRG